MLDTKLTQLEREIRILEEEKANISDQFNRTKCQASETETLLNQTRLDLQEMTT